MSGFFSAVLLRQQLYFTQLAALGEEIKCSQQSWARSRAGGRWCNPELGSQTGAWGDFGVVKQSCVLRGLWEQQDEELGCCWMGFQSCGSLVVGQSSSGAKKPEAPGAVCVYFCTLPEHAARAELQPCQNILQFWEVSWAQCTHPTGYSVPPSARYPWPGASPSSGLGNSLFSTSVPREAEQAGADVPLGTAAHLLARAGLVPLSLC